jgi:hypothetical protein
VYGKRVDGLKVFLSLPFAGLKDAPVNFGYARGTATCVLCIATAYSSFAACLWFLDPVIMSGK